MSDLCREWSDAFGPGRVLVLRYEQLRAEPRAFLAALARFVVGHEIAGTDTDVRVNDSSGLERHRATPLVRKAARLVGAVVTVDGARAAWEARTIRRAVRDRLGGRGTFPRIDAATRTRIMECARGDRAQLDAMIGAWPPRHPSR